MFRITRQTDYAVRVVLALAQHPLGTRLTTRTIQESMQIPQAFLQRIVAQLAQSQLIRTFPGRNGGLALSRPPEEITLRDVVTSIEGPIIISECIAGDDFCPFESHCPVRRRWGRLQSVILKELSSTNFAMLAKEVNG
jgi:Rrf2 family protein